MIYSVTDTSDSASDTGSLRYALTNTRSGDAIYFNIAGAGTHTIAPGSALPTVAAGVTIDGRTQPNYAGTPLIEIDGSAAGTGVDGLTLQGGDAVYGLDMHSFQTNNPPFPQLPTGGNAITGTGTGITIAQNFLGPNATGTAAPAVPDGGNGIFLHDGASAVISGNVLSANNVDGLLLLDWPNATVQGNIIGLDVTGHYNLGNGSDGIELAGTTTGSGGAFIGGAGHGNVIADNGYDGVAVEDLSTDVAIRANSLFQNQNLAIDNLSTAETTTATTLTSATPNAGSTAVTVLGGVMSGPTNGSAVVEFFASPAQTHNLVSGTPTADARTYLGSATVPTDGNGNGTINATLPWVVADGPVISATATDVTGTTGTGDVSNGVNVSTTFSYDASSHPGITDYTLLLSGGNLEVVQTGNSSNVLAGPAPLTGITNVVITGQYNADDTLRVDLSNFSASAPFPSGGLAFDGNTGTGNNTLDVIGSGSYGGATFDYSGPHSGDVKVTGALGTAVLSYVNLAPVNSLIAAANVTVNLPAGAQATLEADAGQSGMDDVRSTGGPGFETSAFADPTGTLTVKAAGGSSRVQLASLDQGVGPSAEVLAGQAGDLFQVTSSGAIPSGVNLSVGKAELDLNAHSIQIGGLSGDGVVDFLANTGSSLSLGANDATATFAGTIRNSGSVPTELLKAGAGTQTLTGTSSFTGPTDLDAGVLQVDGSLTTNYFVNVYGTLRGVGTVTGVVSGHNGGTLAPGDGGPGVLNTGDIDFTSGGSFVVAIGGKTPGNGAGHYSQDDVTGSVTLGGTLSVSSFAGFVPAAGDRYVIISNDGTDAVSGTFANLPEGAVVSSNFLSSGRAARITYRGGDGNDVVIVVDQLVAQPATITAVAGAPFSGTAATFAASPLESPSAFSATINWGDGTSSPGTISGSAGTYTVAGSHTYAYAGHFTAIVTIQDNLGQTARVASPATATSSSQAVGTHQSASVAFWAGTRGQTLIDSFNGGAAATALANWLATSFPNLYGASLGGGGKTNADVAALLTGLAGSAGTKAEAEILATALNVYATTQALGGSAASSYGFAVTTSGLGAAGWNVQANGAALNLNNNATYTVWAALRAADAHARSGRLVFATTDVRYGEVFNLFHGINQAGGL